MNKLIANDDSRSSNRSISPKDPRRNRKRSNEPYSRNDDKYRRQSESQFSSSSRDSPVNHNQRDRRSYENNRRSRYSESRRRSRSPVMNERRERSRSRHHQTDSFSNTRQRSPSRKYSRGSSRRSLLRESKSPQRRSNSRPYSPEKSSRNKQEPPKDNSHQPESSNATTTEYYRDELFTEAPEKQSDKWNCLNCHAMNYKYKRDCHHCQEPKEKITQNSYQSQFVSSENPPQNNWKCLRCKWFNNGFREDCTRCHKRREEIDTYGYQNQGSSDFHVPIFGNGFATFQFPSTSAFEDRSKGWLCLGCKNINYLARNECYSCPKLRENEDTVIDVRHLRRWKCANCETRNHRFCTSCSVCHSLKDNSDQSNTYSHQNQDSSNFQADVYFETFEDSFTQFQLPSIEISEDKNKRWQCSGCKHYNSLTYNDCKNCSKLKENEDLVVDVQLLKKWYCVSCGKCNHRLRSDCIGCNHLKDDQADESKVQDDNLVALDFQADNRSRKRPLRRKSCYQPEKSFEEQQNSKAPSTRKFPPRRKSCFQPNTNKAFNQDQPTEKFPPRRRKSTYQQNSDYSFEQANQVDNDLHTPLKRESSYQESHHPKDQQTTKLPQRRNSCYQPNNNESLGDTLTDIPANCQSTETITEKVSSQSLMSEISSISSECVESKRRRLNPSEEFLHPRFDEPKNVVKSCQQRLATDEPKSSLSIVSHMPTKSNELTTPPITLPVEATAIVADQATKSINSYKIPKLQPSNSKASSALNDCDVVSLDSLSSISSTSESVIEKVKNFTNNILQKTEAKPEDLVKDLEKALGLEALQRLKSILAQGEKSEKIEKELPTKTAENKSVNETKEQTCSSVDSETKTSESKNKEKEDLKKRDMERKQTATKSTSKTCHYKSELKHQVKRQELKILPATVKKGEVKHFATKSTSKGEKGFEKEVLVKSSKEATTNSSESRVNKKAHKEQTKEAHEKSLVTDKAVKKSSDVNKKNGKVLTSSGKELKSVKKRHLNELDKLHLDINECYDSYDITHSGGPRSCTKYLKSKHVDLVPDEEHLMKFNITDRCEIKINRLDLTNEQMPVKINRVFISKHPELGMELERYLDMMEDDNASFGSSDDSDINDTEQKLEKKVSPSMNKIFKAPAPISPKKQSSSTKESTKTLVKKSPSSRRRRNWSHGIIKQKKKSQNTVNTKVEDEWEDVPESPKEVKEVKKVKLIKLVEFMNFFDKKTVSVKPNKAFPRQEPFRQKSSITISDSGKQLKCDLCSFESSEKLIFHQHIKSKHLMNDVDGDSSESKLNHMLKLFEAKQDDNLLVGISSAEVKPMLKLRSLPGDKLSTVSKAEAAELQEQNSAEDKLQLNDVRLNHLLVKTSNGIVLRPAFGNMQLTVKKIKVVESPTKAAAAIKTSPEPTPTVNIKYQVPKLTSPVKITPKVSPAISSQTKPIKLKITSKVPTLSLNQLPPVKTLSKIPTSSQTTQRKPVKILPKFLPSSSNQHQSEKKVSQVQPSSNLRQPAQIKSLDQSENSSEMFSLLNQPSTSTTSFQTITLRQTAANAFTVLTTQQTVQTETLQPKPAKSPAIQGSNYVSNYRTPRPWINNSISYKPDKGATMLKNQKCLAALYKCMGSTCSFFTSYRSVFEKHLLVHMEHQSEDQMNFLLCAYCTSSTTTIESLLIHISTFHGYDKYQCNYCFYRAYSDFHVFHQHQSLYHKNEEKVVIECLATPSRNINKEMQKVKKTINLFVPQVKCIG